MATAPNITIERTKQTFQFRGEAFEIVYHVCVDQETGERFTTDELDQLNLIQVHNQYRAKYGIPFVDEIKAIREQYGLTAAKMSEILGFGTNGYKNYENGEIPSIPHGRYIQLIKDPQEFYKLIELNRKELSEEEIEKINKKVKQRLSGWEQTDTLEASFIFGDTTPSEFNGYRKPVIERVGQMAAFFAEKLRPFTTKLNKLLFYADFLHYRKTGYSISGLNYIAIKHGPVPKKYGTIYSSLYEKGYVDLNIVDFGDGIEGEQFLPSGKGVDWSDFTEDEIVTLKEVVQSVGPKNTKQIVDFSHQEFAWKHNVNDRSPISYDYGFYLQPL